MALTGVGSTTTTSSSDATAKATTLGKDDFLKLLMAQLGNQDPTSPVDSQAFVTQLAQFSNVEQLQSVNKSLDLLLASQSTTHQTSVVSLVGKDALLSNDTLTLKQGQSATLVAQLSDSADSVTTLISDPTGKVVRTARSGAHAGGPLEVTWDGRDDQGQRLPDGDYTAQVTAATRSGASVPVVQQVKARITGASFVDGAPELVIGNQRVKLSEVAEVLQPVD